MFIISSKYILHTALDIKICSIPNAPGIPDNTTSCNWHKLYWFQNGLLFKHITWQYLLHICAKGDMQIAYQTSPLGVVINGTRILHILNNYWHGVCKASWTPAQDRGWNPEHHGWRRKYLVILYLYSIIFYETSRHICISRTHSWYWITPLTSCTEGLAQLWFNLPLWIELSVN